MCATTTHNNSNIARRSSSSSGQCLFSWLALTATVAVLLLFIGRSVSHSLYDSPFESPFNGDINKTESSTTIVHNPLLNLPATRFPSPAYTHSPTLLKSRHNNKCYYYQTNFCYLIALSASMIFLLLFLYLRDSVPYFHLTSTVYPAQMLSLLIFARLKIATDKKIKTPWVISKSTPPLTPTLPLLYRSPLRSFSSAALIIIIAAPETGIVIRELAEFNILQRQIPLINTSRGHFLRITSTTIHRRLVHQPTTHQLVYSLELGLDQ